MERVSYVSTVPELRSKVSEWRARGETVAVCESSAGGLISSALLAVPGASRYFRGGAVVYTGEARCALGWDEADRIEGGEGA